MSGADGLGWGPPVTTSDEFALAPSTPQWPDGGADLRGFVLAPPTPCPPRSENVACAWREGVDLHGTAFAVLHGRSSSDPRALRRYAAAVLAAAEMIEKGSGMGLDEAGLAELAPMSVVTGEQGLVAQATPLPVVAGLRWALPGMPGLLTDAELLATGHTWSVLRAGDGS